MPDFTIKFPLEFSNESNGFTTIGRDQIKEMVNFNLKNIILTNPGERIMFPQFGVGIKRFLFDQEKMRQEEIEYNIRSQIKTYANYVNVENLQMSLNENSLKIQLKYNIKEMDVSDLLILDITL